MKNKKSLFIFLGIFIFMIIPKNVYAATTLFGGFNNTHPVWSTNSNEVYIDFSPGVPSDTNYGDGILSFSFLYEYNFSLIPYEVDIYYHSWKSSSCILSPISVGDSTNSTYTVVSVSCPVFINSSDWPYSIRFKRNGTSNQSQSITVSDKWTFQSMSIDMSSLINSQNQNWNNFNNADLDSSDKEAPNTDNYTDYQTAENNLFDKMDEADTDSLNVAIDSNSATWVWDRITEWLGTHALLMSFLVSMLSIGIIKMALGR